MPSAQQRRGAIRRLAFVVSLGGMITGCTQSANAGSTSSPRTSTPATTPTKGIGISRFTAEGFFTSSGGDMEYVSWKLEGPTHVVSAPQTSGACNYALVGATGALSAVIATCLLGASPDLNWQTVASDVDWFVGQFTLDQTDSTAWLATLLPSGAAASYGNKHASKMFGDLVATYRETTANETATVTIERAR